MPCGLAASCTTLLQASGSLPAQLDELVSLLFCLSDTLDAVERELCIEPSVPALLAIRGASELMGLEAANSLPSQLDQLAAVLLQGQVEFAPLRHLEERGLVRL